MLYILTKPSSETICLWITPSSIYKCEPMIRKIESQGYKAMYLPPYSPELIPIKQFWSLERKNKAWQDYERRHLSSKIGDAYNDVLISVFFFLAFAVTLNAESLSAATKHRSNTHVLFFKKINVYLLNEEPL